MQNINGNFRVRCIWTAHDAKTQLRSWLTMVALRKPPLSLKVDVFSWTDNEGLATIFPNSERALEWMAFIVKHTRAQAVEIVRGAKEDGHV